MHIVTFLYKEVYCLHYLLAANVFNDRADHFVLHRKQHFWLQYLNNSRYIPLDLYIYIIYEY